MSVFPRTGALVAFVVMSAAVPAVGQLTNPSFENNDFTSGTNFAGGISKSLPTTSPVGWSYQGSQSGNADRWVKSAAAHSGNKFIYMSSANPFPNDDCLLTKPCFGAGQTFSFSVFAASASLLPGTNRMLFEFREQLSGGGILETQYTFDIPANAAWSDTAISTIPWAQFTHNHTYQANAISADFWITSARSASGGTSSVVFDDAGCALVPAPSSVALIGASLITGLRRRRR